MIAKRLLFSLLMFFLFFELSGSRAFGNELESEKQIIAQLTTFYDSQSDVKLINERLAKLSPSLSGIVGGVFKAKELARKADALNASSTELFKKALAEVSLLNRDDLKLWVSCEYAFYLYSYRKYADSFPVFLQTISILDQIDQLQIINPTETFKKIGFFLMTMGEYDKAKHYLLRARHFAKGNHVELASILNNLGVISLREGKLVEAEAYINETIQISKKNRDHLRYAKALGSLGEVKFKQKQDLLAIQLFEEDIKLSKQVGNSQNTTFALVKLSELYVAKGEIKKANELLREAKSYVGDKVHLKSVGYEINQLMLEIAKRTGDEKSELKARRELERLDDKLVGLDGHTVIAKVGLEMQKRTLQLTIEAERTKKEKEALVKILAIVTCGFLLLIILLVVKRYSKRMKAEKDGYEQKLTVLLRDKQVSEKRLTASEQTMQSYQTYLKEKMVQIAHLDKEIRRLKGTATRGSEKYVGQMEELLSSHLLNRDQWISFKGKFIENYPTYYQHLCENFSGLSDANLRIIFLQKLEMNNVETARILGLTLDAVKKAKQRLRFKYGANYDALFKEELLV